jgi:hypothetical protein
MEEPLMTDDERDARIAELTADEQRIRASALPAPVKRAMLDDMEGERRRLERERRQLRAQKTNGVSPMEQESRRLS